MNDGAATSSGKTSRRAPRFLAWRATVGLTIALLVCPLFVDLAVSGVRGGFRYVAADSFYYLTVARNVAQSGRFSFDQQTVTNGFHPLWQLVLVLVYGAGHAAGVTDSALLVAVVVVNAISLAGAVYFIGLAVKDEDRLPPVFVLVPVGTLGLLLAPMWLVLGPARVAKESIAEGGRPLYGTLWSYANGMESALLLLLFGATAAMFVRGYWARGRRHAVAFGLLLGALVLARLDHVWLSVLVAAWLLIASWKKSDNARACSLATCETLAVVIVAYLVVNRVAFGSAVPVSGKLKTSFPHFATDNIATLGLMLRGEWPG